MDPNEKLLNQAANAKLIRLNEEIIGPWVARAIDEKLSEACEAAKQGEVKLGAISYIAALRDLMSTLQTKAGQGERAAAKLIKQE